MFENVLNKEQYESVIETNKPLLVLSGAGTGKTRIITYKIAYLAINNNIELNRIASFTFTNKSAQEMFSRTVNILNNKEFSHAGEVSRSQLFIGTFHSNCLKMLRQHATFLGYSRSFGVVDEGDKTSLLKEIIKDCSLKNDLKVKYVKNRISDFKNKLQSCQDVQRLVESSEDENQEMSDISQIYTLYTARLLSMNLMDFDDLIANTIRLLHGNKDLREFWQDHFQYILVDEFQDTNHAQFLLLTLLANKDGSNLTMVGDDDQSIYSFRGASIATILNLKRHFKDLKTIKVEKNYRCTQNILNVANKVIKHNQNRIGKELYSIKKSSDDKYPLLFSAMSQDEEVDFVMGAIQQHEDSKDSIAIIYRTNAQSRSFEVALNRLGLEYSILGGNKFYDRKEIKDIVAYLKLIYNIKDDISFKRIVNIPTRGVGGVSVAKIMEYSQSQKISCLESLASLKEWGKQTAFKISPKSIDSLENFYNLITDLRKTSIEEPSRLVNILIKSIDYMEWLVQDEDSGAGRVENVQELSRFYEAYFEDSPEASFESFMETLSLQENTSDIHDKNQSKKEQEQSNIFLSTVHGCKGLEFDHVFIVGLGEEIFPHYNSIHSEEELEEEYRLFYVATTRAKKTLSMSYSQEVFLFGSYHYCQPSQFFKLLNDTLVFRV